MADDVNLDEETLQDAFDEGAASLDAPPATVTEKDKPAEPAPAAAKEAKADPAPVIADKPAAPKVKYVQITEEDYKQFKTLAEKTGALEQQMSKAFGTIGNVQQIVERLKAATPEGVAIEIPKDAFADMERDFPELAAHLKKGLEASLKGIRGTGTAPAADTEAIAKQISERVRESTKAAQAEVLEDFYPNWKEIVGAVPDGKYDPKHPFRVWLKTQPEAYQVQINNTNSAAIISRAIGKYEAAAAAAKKAPPTPVPPKVNPRAARIAAAVTPKGDGGRPAQPTKSADDDFNEGFRAG